MTNALLTITVYAAFAAGLCLIQRQPVSLRSHFARPPWVLLVVVALTGALSGLQFAFPGILTSLERNRAHLLDGQVWRLISPLFVQDGGVAGTIFNLITLVLLGVLAIVLLGWRRWLVLYFGTGIASEIVAYTLIHQGEAGNSIANFGVAAGLIVLALHHRQMPCAVAGGIGLLTGLTLLALGNLHGAAFAIGLALSAILIIRDPHRQLAAPDKVG